MMRTELPAHIPRVGRGGNSVLITHCSIVDSALTRFDNEVMSIRIEESATPTAQSSLLVAQS